MNHALFCVTPRARDNSHELIPFLALTISQTAGNHFSKPIGESSKMVPTLAVNCFLHSWQFQRRRGFSPLVLVNFTLLLWHSGHLTPFGQRIRTMKSCATSGSAK